MTAFASDLLRDLSARGFIKDCTDLSGLDALLASGRKVAAYAGFDPTADGLHVGHLMSLTLLRRFRDAGHTAVAVVGTATAAVGDPSGRQSARPMLGDEEIARNADGIERDIRAVLGAERTVVLRNGDWLGAVGWIDGLRRVGARIPVSRMLALDSVRTRLDGGLSYLEFSYSLLQALDFLHLSGAHPDLVQVGGSDQWGNICMGVELIAKERGARGRGGGFPLDGGGTGHAFGLTHPLLLKANGEKMGKSASGAVWLSAGRLPDADFFRFWRDQPDAEVARLLRLFTGLAPGDCARWEGDVGEAANAAKDVLAFEVTAAVRGADAARAARDAARAAFGGAGEMAATAEATAAEAADLPGLLVRLGLAGSRSEARRLSAQGAVRVNGRKTGRPGLDPADFPGGTARVTVGRKRHAAVRLLG